MSQYEYENVYANVIYEIYLGSPIPNGSGFLWDLLSRWKSFLGLKSDHHNTNK